MLDQHLATVSLCQDSNGWKMPQSPTPDYSKSTNRSTVIVRNTNVILKTIHQKENVVTVCQAAKLGWGIKPEMPK